MENSVGDSNIYNHNADLIMIFKLIPVLLLIVLMTTVLIQTTLTITITTIH